MKILSDLKILALPVLLLVGCGGGGSKSHPDLSGNTGDMSGTSSDMPATGCTKVATWPATNTTVIGIPDPVQGISFLTAGYESRPSAMASLNDVLNIEVWNPSGGPDVTVPTTFTFASTDQYNTCTGCLSISIGLDPTDPSSTPSTFYFAQSGSMTVTKANRNAGSGMFAATGTNVHLVEWSYFDSAMSDSAIAGGTCYDIASFAVTGSYMNSIPDGGTTD